MTFPVCACDWWGCMPTVWYCYIGQFALRSTNNGIWTFVSKGSFLRSIWMRITIAGELIPAGAC